MEVSVCARMNAWPPLHDSLALGCKRFSPPAMADRHNSSMKRRSYIVSSSAVVTLAFVAPLLMAPASANEKVVLIGDENYPPYSYIENGKFTGIDVDILRLAASRLAPAYRVELVPRPWKRGLAMLENGSAFALFPPGLKRERTYIDTYSVPILTERVIVLCNSEVARVPRPVFPRDYSGLTIGINAGFLLSERLMQAEKLRIVRLESAKDNATNLLKLALHRIDCYASDGVAALFSAKKLADKLPAAERELRPSVELSREDTFVAYSARNSPSFKTDFIAKLDAALDTMRTNGDIDRIIARYVAIKGKRSLQIVPEGPAQPTYPRGVLILEERSVD